MVVSRRSLPGVNSPSSPFCLSPSVYWSMILALYLFGLLISPSCCTLQNMPSTFPIDESVEALSCDNLKHAKTDCYLRKLFEEKNDKLFRCLFDDIANRTCLSSAKQCSLPRTVPELPGLIVFNHAGALGKAYIQESAYVLHVKGFPGPQKLTAANVGPRKFLVLLNNIQLTLSNSTDLSDQFPIDNIDLLINGELNFTLQWRDERLNWLGNHWPNITKLPLSEFNRSATVWQPKLAFVPVDHKTSINEKSTAFDTSVNEIDAFNCDVLLNRDGRVDCQMRPKAISVVKAGSKLSSCERTTTAASTCERFKCCMSMAVVGPKNDMDKFKLVLLNSRGKVQQLETPAETKHVISLSAKALPSDEAIIEICMETERPFLGRFKLAEKQNFELVLAGILVVLVLLLLIPNSVLKLVIIFSGLLLQIWFYWSQKMAPLPFTFSDRGVSLLQLSIFFSFLALILCCILPLYKRWKRNVEKTDSTKIDSMSSSINNRQNINRLNIID